MGHSSLTKASYYQRKDAQKRTTYAPHPTRAYYIWGGVPSTIHFDGLLISY